MNQELRNASARLSFVSGRLADHMASIEDALQRLNLGVEAWVAIEPSTLFGYARLSAGRWRFAIQTEHDTRELSAAPRHLRAAVVPLLPLLFEQLRVEAEKLLTQLTAACQLAEEMATGVRQAQAEIAAEKAARVRA
jgi:hypothetical protein